MGPHTTYNHCIFMYYGTPYLCIMGPHIYALLDPIFMYYVTPYDLQSLHIYVLWDPIRLSHCIFMYYGTPYDLQSLHIYVLWDPI